MMQDLEWGIPSEQSERDLPQADTITIRDMGPVIRAAGNGATGQFEPNFLVKTD